MIKNVCIFASSSNGLDSIYYEAAEKLGICLGQAGFNIVYGGSNRGLMWTCASKVKDFCGIIYGVMPEKLNDFGVSASICDKFFLTKGMRERKAKMDELSDAVIALPGGFGTLEELSEMIVQKQLGYNAKPIILYNVNNFYDKLNEFFEIIINQHFAKDNIRDAYFISSSPTEIIDYLLNYKGDENLVSKNDIYIN